MNRALGHRTSTGIGYVAIVAAVLIFGGPLYVALNWDSLSRYWTPAHNPQNAQNPPSEALAALSGPSVAGEPFDVVGLPRVVDGDTLAFGDLSVRLVGIDAPEADQPCYRGGPSGEPYLCGEWATASLQRWLRSGPEWAEVGMAPASVGCDSQGTDRYGRMLAVCFWLDAEAPARDVDLGRFLVSEGMAIRFMDDGAYAAEQERAVAGRRGLWADSFVAPAEWRKVRAAE